MSRLPRFNRSPDAARIRLTDRDREIIRLVHRHRFLRSHHLIDLLAASRQQVLRRLQLLYHHGYLERPPTQIAYYERGSRPMVYGIGNKGAALLKRKHGLAFHELDWGAKNRGVTRLFLDHALLISDVMVELELACRKNGRVRLLTGKEIPLPDALRTHRQPFKWRVPIKSRGKLGVIPDGAFVLEFADRPPTATVSCIFSKPTVAPCRCSAARSCNPRSTGNSSPTKPPGRRTCIASDSVSTASGSSPSRPALRA